ncbi:hypothetical protein ACQZ4Q_23075 [Agrobacterium vitis]|uniref:hypothetical protein n=1 Tax=Agrobacterium vitis TaxID=373 RepID=UPI00157482DB|nr:hypothetical protein [Agrobacterium vitis]WEO75488.1 hypothetical protein G6L01_026975 [Agrobacterium vitis]
MEDIAEEKAALMSSGDINVETTIRLPLLLLPDIGGERGAVASRRIIANGF